MVVDFSGKIWGGGFGQYLALSDAQCDPILHFQPPQFQLDLVQIEGDLCARFLSDQKLLTHVMEPRRHLRFQ